jgi:hypothetical protein
MISKNYTEQELTGKKIDARLDLIKPKLRTMAQGYANNPMQFRTHEVHRITGIHILCTFNPDTGNRPSFFSGKTRNFLCILLPAYWNERRLKVSPDAIKGTSWREVKLIFPASRHLLVFLHAQSSNVLGKIY